MIDGSVLLSSSHLLTSNPQDFKRFTGLTTVHPDDIQLPTT
jgi:hypothetical protein